MSTFDGMTVKVTLQQPPNTVVHGRVKEVVAGQTLSLDNVFFPASGTRFDNWTVQGSLIADLEVIGTNAVPAPTPQPQKPAPISQPPTTSLPIRGPNLSHPSVTHESPHLQPASRQTSDFVDPAILSFGRSPVQQKAAPIPAPVPVAPLRSHALSSKVAAPPSRQNGPIYTGQTVQNTSQDSPRTREAISTSRPSRNQDVAIENSAEYPEQGDEVSRKKKQRQPRQKAKKVVSASNDPPPVMNADVSRSGIDMNGNVKRGKGWRQTPLLQPSPHSSIGTRKKSRRQRDEKKESQNGWATEDATDIQDMGEFDFEANHKLFDKKQVFDQLRMGDTTADEDRLVSHNKLPRKNLLPTENVLSPRIQTEDVSSDADTEMNFHTGRSSSRHSLTKRQPTRTNSTAIEGKTLPRAPSDRALSRSATSVSRSGRAAPKPLGSASRADRTQSPQSAVSSARVNGKPLEQIENSDIFHFELAPSRAACPVLHPSALETLELETTSRYGLTIDAITETAARSIAEATMSMFDDVDENRRGSRGTAGRGSLSTSGLLMGNDSPVVVVLASNHAIGARAIAAARHLSCRKVKIIIAEGLHNLVEGTDEQSAKQVLMLKRMMRAGANIKRGPWQRASNYIKKLSGPPAVIIDALLAGETYDSITDTAEQHSQTSQQEIREMIDWANRSRAPVLSIGCPSGVSGIDGSATIVEGEPLAVRPDRVLALGAPLQGLLEAMKGGERWDVSLADIGINIALKTDDAVAFGPHWVSKLEICRSDD